MNYVNQVISIKRPSTTLGIDVYPSSPKDEAPLELHDGFSRFVVTIVDKEHNIQPTANIPMRDVAGIVYRSKFAFNKLYSEAENVEEEEQKIPQSAAYTEKIKLRPFVGMTPAEVLIKDAANRGELERLRDEVLAKNADKYAANRKQMAAINDAISLLEGGNLNGEEIKVKKTVPFPIYTVDYKFKSKTNDKGYNLVYNIDITCDVSRKYPFIITVKNFYAPVETNKDGTKNIVTGKAEDNKTAVFRLTDSEYASLIDTIKNTKYHYEELVFKKQFELFQANSYKHES